MNLGIESGFRLLGRSLISLIFILNFLPAKELIGQPYGLDARPAVGSFLNHQMPEVVPPAGNYQAIVAFTNLNFYYAVGLTHVPGANRLCVWEREGRVYTFENHPSASVRTLVLDISNQCQGWDASGLLGLAFHPGFVTNHFVFVYYTWVPPGTVVGSPTQRPATVREGYYHDRLSRFTLDSDGVAIPDSELVLVDLTVNSVWHKGGGMFFHPQNRFLYLTDGDDQTSPNASQVITNSLIGGVWRIDVDQRGGSVSHPTPRQPLNGMTANYFIPNNNPFVGQPRVMEEFFAIGLRSPHRMTCDPVTGRIFIGDVGFGTREEIDVIEPSDPPGLNFQWPQAEGNLGQLRRPYVGVSKPPILDYDRTDGAAVIGGYVYRGSDLPELSGKYIFGDNVTRNIWALDESGGTAQKTLLCVVPRGCCTNDASDHLGISSFGVDRNGEVYIVQLGETSGRIYKLAHAGPPAVFQQFPLLLSQTGAFTDTPNLVPSPALIPYTVNSPLWSDRAVKQRWMVLATNSTINFKPAGEWSFPNGSVFVKHFELPVNDTNTNVLRRLETRFLVRDTNGAAYGVTYKWRSDNSDADLLANSLSENITITTAAGTRAQQWYYPGRADCLRCHTPAAGYVLGVKTRQLNGNLTYPGTGVTDNQLRSWNHIGLFSADTPLAEADIPGFDKLAKISDTSAPLEHRVRSYLDANCSQCHRPGGVQEAILDARFDTPLTSQHIVNAPVLNALGIANARIVVPQDRSHSILYLRANNVGNIQMPPVARNVVDTNFIDTLAKWISVVTPPTPSGPVNWWKLDETSGAVAADSAGSANGVYQDGVMLNQTGAGPDTANSVHLGGASGAVAIPALNYNANTLTITAWMKRDGIQADGAGLIFCRTANTAAGLFLDAAKNLRYSWNDDPMTWGWNSGLALPDNQWVLVALVVEPMQATIFLRGGERLFSATNPVHNDVEEFDGTLYFGRDAIDSTRQFAGWLDDVRIYNRALPATEIEQLYAATAGHPTTRPLITLQPSNTIALLGTMTALHVEADGAEPRRYQWSKGGSRIRGATNSTLSFTNARTTDTGNYQVRISNQFGRATSRSARLTVIVPVAITAQPRSKTVLAGARVLFRVRVSSRSTRPFTYQWLFNGTPLTNATARSLRIAHAASNDAGSYSVIVSNAAGSVTSSVATLNITARTLARAAGAAESIQPQAGPATLSISRSPSDGVKLKIVGPPGRRYSVETSSDLRHWLPSGALTNATGRAEFLDPAATSEAQRFYRIIGP